MPRKKKDVEKAATPTLDELLVAKAPVVVSKKAKDWRHAQEARHAGKATVEDEVRVVVMLTMAEKNAAKLANWQAERERKHAGVG